MCFNRTSVQLLQQQCAKSRLSFIIYPSYEARLRRYIKRKIKKPFKIINPAEERIVCLLFCEKNEIACNVVILMY